MGLVEYEYSVENDDVVVLSNAEFIEKLAGNEKAKKLLYRIARLVEELVEELYSDGESYVYPSEFEIAVSRDFDGILRIRVNPLVEYDNA